MEGERLHAFGRYILANAGRHARKAGVVVIRVTSRQPWVAAGVREQQKSSPHPVYHASFPVLLHSCETYDRDRPHHRPGLESPEDTSTSLRGAENDMRWGPRTEGCLAVRVEVPAIHPGVDAHPRARDHDVPWGTVKRYFCLKPSPEGQFAAVEESMNPLQIATASVARCVRPMRGCGWNAGGAVDPLGTRSSKAEDGVTTRVETIDREMGFFGNRAPANPRGDIGRTAWSALQASAWHKGDQENPLEGTSAGGSRADTAGPPFDRTRARRGGVAAGGAMAGRTVVVSNRRSVSCDSGARHAEEGKAHASAVSVGMKSRGGAIHPDHDGGVSGSRRRGAVKHSRSTRD